KYEMYRDTLDNHTVTMRRNVNGKQEYVPCDYSLLHIPWGVGITAEKLRAQLLAKNKKFAPNHICVIGTMYQVVKDTGICMPEFETEEEKLDYANKYVFGKFTWFHAEDYK